MLRYGRTNTLWILLLVAGAAVAVLVAALQLGGPGRAPEANQLTVYCAAGVRFPVEEIAQQYKQEFGIPVEIQFGGSNTLLSQIKANTFDTADLYLAADDFYTRAAQDEGFAAESLPIAHMRPVIAVPKDGGKPIGSVEDLLADDVQVALADPDQAAVGRETRNLLQRVAVDDTTLWDKLEQHVTSNGVMKTTVTEVANDVKIGAVDAGIVWDATVAMPSFQTDLKAVTVDELDGEPNLVSICVLNSSPNPTAALKFARFLTARDRGLPAFEKFGLRPVEGDRWAERPEIKFYCGAVNRRAVEQIVDDFQKREDVLVDTIYDGCGILTGKMKGIEGQSTDLGFPDVYMACDVYYLENVKQWFQEAANVSDVEIVIAVPKGSTKVKQLADLIQPGVRVAVGQPEQCTIGALTRRLLAREGLYEKLMDKQQQEKEVVVEKSSSALLVPDVVAGHVDAAVAYITDVLANQDTIDIVRIESPLNRAIQPLSIAKTSDHKHLVRRLFRRIADSPEAFQRAGFHFRLSEENGEDEARSETPEAERS
jgi:molybdenum ABC transporter molybdate-binding protein